MTARVFFDTNVLVYAAIGTGKLCDRLKESVSPALGCTSLGVDRAVGGAILAAAEALGAGTVYLEDLNDGQQYGRVRVVNPFA